MDTDLHFGILLKRVFYLWHQVINERLRPRGVSHSQWRVVLELSRSPTPMTQTALAAELGVESPTMVRLLDRLADKGWLAREACPADRRARHVRLTPRAQKLARELEEDRPQGDPRPGRHRERQAGGSDHQASLPVTHGSSP